MFSQEIGYQCLWGIAALSGFVFEAGGSWKAWELIGSLMQGENKKSASGHKTGWKSVLRKC